MLCTEQVEATAGVARFHWFSMWVEPNDKDVGRSRAMFGRILVPLDGSELAERAIPIAARIARGSGGTIVFVCVVLPPVEFGTFSVEQEHLIALKPGAFERRLAEAESYLRDIAITHADVLASIETEVDITTGAAAPTIFSTARLEEVDLIVLYSHGETGLKRWVFGSVAQQAVRHSPAPVLVLHEHGRPLRAWDITHPLRILVALDRSALAEAALEPAIQLQATWTNTSAEVQGELHLLCVVDLPSAYGRMKSQAHISDSIQEEVRHEAEAYVKAVAGRLRAGPQASDKLMITSSVVMAGAMIELAERVEGTEHAETLSRGQGIQVLQGSYDLIAMATHGRSGLRRVVMGSVTEHVLDTTRLPLLIVRPPETDTQREQVAETARPEKEAGAERQGWQMRSCASERWPMGVRH
jgi:nucleotide-binding universal stress UspA family protein